MTKRFTLISSGWFLKINPNLQYYGQPALFRFISVSVIAAGSLFHCIMNTINLARGANGCRTEHFYFDYGLTDITIRRSNNIIIQNYVKGRVSLS